MFAVRFDAVANRGATLDDATLEILDFEVGVDKIALDFDYTIVDRFTGRAGEILIRDTGPQLDPGDFYSGEFSQSILIDRDGNGVEDAAVQLYVPGALIDGSSIMRLSQVGTDTRDSLKGASSNDVLYGGMGDDEVRGADGDDRIFGSWGQDSLFG